MYFHPLQNVVEKVRAGRYWIFTFTRFRDSCVYTYCCFGRPLHRAERLIILISSKATILINIMPPVFFILIFCACVCKLQGKEHFYPIFLVINQMICYMYRQFTKNVFLKNSYNFSILYDDVFCHKYSNAICMVIWDGRLSLPWLAHAIEYTMTFDQIGKRQSEILLHVTDIITKSRK